MFFFSSDKTHIIVIYLIVSVEIQILIHIVNMKKKNKSAIDPKALTLTKRLWFLVLVLEHK